MPINLGSIGTGLPKDIVQQIMKAEQVPVQQMEARKAGFVNQRNLVDELMKLVQALRDNLIANRTPKSFREITSNYNEGLINMALDKNIAEPGSYQFEVVQLAGKSSAITSGVSDPDESYLGVGYLEYNLPNGDTKEVYIDPQNSSLHGIAKLINSDSANHMRASVIQDGKDEDSPWRLIIALDETGDANKVEFPALYLVDGREDLYIDHEREAKDAIVKMDGFEIELPSNTAKDLIPGASIDLLKADPGNEFTIEIKADTTKITEKVNAIVENINAVLSFISKQNALDEKSDTKNTLGGDLSLQSLESRIRSMVFRFVETSFGSRRVGDIGIEFQRNGLLKLDAGKFEKQLKENYKLVAETLIGFTDPIEGTIKNGFIQNVSDLASEAVALPAGILASRKNGLNSNIQRIDQNIENKLRFLQKKEENLKRKFSKLEETMSELRTQGQGLAGFAGAAAAGPQLGG